ncbi:hypothetical protein PHET_11035 [Paragonimus heterotremus]|uniref:Uncharacterized protein n=1 Tax=Paragonimus heterotremus TaxID=100268 RepID=A0A8J4T6A4_9TREM|nr:hypothetical protein PHET_11035 [Paragonimus heterotremus]
MLLIPPCLVFVTRETATYLSLFRSSL